MRISRCWSHARCEARTMRSGPTPWRALRVARGGRARRGAETAGTRGLARDGKLRAGARGSGHWRGLAELF